ncbi:MAG: hypothetical protein ACRERV_03070, partial [Methylococcales bacterium]
LATACGSPLTTGVRRNILNHVGMGRPRGTGATFHPGKAYSQPPNTACAPGIHVWFPPWYL